MVPIFITDWRHNERYFNKNIFFSIDARGEAWWLTELPRALAIVTWTIETSVNVGFNEGIINMAGRRTAFKSYSLQRFLSILCPVAGQYEIVRLHLWRGK